MKSNFINIKMELEYMYTRAINVLVCATMLKNRL